jgi:REP-associated tyrosine transposase
MNHSKESLSHTRWECKYHVVFIPKYGKKSIYGWVRKELGPIMRGLAQQKEVVVEEGDLIPDHVPMLLIEPAEVFGIRAGGVYQGEERGSDRPAVYGSGEELCRAEFLGEGILRIDGGSRRGADPQLHQRARERG